MVTTWSLRRMDRADRAIRYGPGAISLAQLTGVPDTAMYAKFSRCLYG